MKKEVILLSTVLTLMTSGQVWAAACATPPDCASLGYTMNVSECGGRTALKCPSDPSKVWCDKPADTGLKVGDILYSDKTTSPAVISGKTPIGVVIDVKQRLAISLEEKNTPWAIKDSPCEKMEFNGSDESWSRTKAIYDNCGEDAPAASFCYNYKTEGTKVGDWAMPSESDAEKIFDSCSEFGREIECSTDSYHPVTSVCKEFAPLPFGWDIPRSCDAYTSCGQQCLKIDFSTCTERFTNSKYKACSYPINYNLRKLNKPNLGKMWLSTLHSTILSKNANLFPLSFYMFPDEDYKEKSYPTRCIIRF